ncbi:MAG: SPOR domain-containing protein [Candidatus Accumulibacter sp.]|jgi:DedD protein|nr:SPOR domain-containing protein [Accumulibacter sp.]
MPDSADAKLQLKKRARRRLIGSVAFAGLVAVVLPMVMDAEPPQPARNVRIRIPGEETPFRPGEPVSVPLALPPPVVVENSTVSTRSPESPTDALVEDAPPKSVSPKPVEKPPERARVKPQEKPVEKLTPAQLAEKKRAEAILGGRFAEPESSVGKVFIVMIGTFSDPASVRTLQTKFGQLNVKTFTEDFDSPSGKKTRLRAGPFSTELAAKQALEKMQRIGVNGIVSSRPQ